MTALPAAREKAEKERDTPPERGSVAEPTDGPEEPTSLDGRRSTLEGDAAQGAPTLIEPASADEDAEVAERHSVDLLGNAVARIEAARAELASAETALDAAVAAAREGGLSWRTIGNATGLRHREASARWGPPEGGPSL